VYAAAQAHLPGGVSAAARIHASLGGPFTTARGEGGRAFEVDGNG
jgi:glutamate-1-semialdehyde aminotransferase